MFRFITMYYGCSGTFKATTIESILTRCPGLYNVMWSDIKPWKRWENILGTQQDDRNYAILHLCNLRNAIKNNWPPGVNNLLVERGVSDMLYYYYKNNREIGENSKWIKDVVHEEDILCEQNSYYTPRRILLVQKDFDFVRDVILREPTRAKEFPGGVQEYMEHQDAYVEFTQKYNKIDEVINIKDAEKYVNDLGFEFDPIEKAILNAMKSSGIKSPKVAFNISKEIEEELKEKGSCTIDEIENLVYDKLIKKGHKLTAKAYEGYRSVREFQQQSNTIDEQINELLAGDSEYWKSENSNKDSMLLTVQRDYMAGIVSIDMARRKIFPPEIIQAHDEGLIHIHDLDYIGQLAMNNCCLINLEDMLQNGTCINKTKIFKPHKLITATTIATQIITAVSSSQYGGCTITLTHLAPFVRDSYNGSEKI